MLSDFEAVGNEFTRDFVLRDSPSSMRSESDKSRVLLFIREVGRRLRGPGRIYLAGGSTAVLHGWRETTIDIDIKADPEPAGLFEALALLKDDLDINVELASPDDFIPAIPGWRERSLFISREGLVDFFHYDPYGQALAKLQRQHDRDLVDVRALLSYQLIDVQKMRDFFSAIEPELIRYPAIDARSFRAVVLEFCDANS